MPQGDAPNGRRRGRRDAREWIAFGFTRVEDIVYIGLAALLAASALVLLVTGAVAFVQQLLAGTLLSQIVAMLDRTLLILLIVEILYTVQVSFREHALVPEPFLIIGLIATTRRVLVLTAEVGNVAEMAPETFRRAMIELGILTVMVVALVASLVLLRKRAAHVVADRA
jgi:uncharacterized membrane protein (DUF373 family)